MLWALPIAACCFRRFIFAKTGKQREQLLAPRLKLHSVRRVDSGNQ